jgi:oxygen-independent coproporphyrinogen III oxidase
MAGIYLHIPFCSQKCTYCDFYSIVAPSKMSEFINALVKEIDSRVTYLNGEQVKTVYFGGGTPSLLREQDWTIVFDSILKNFTLTENAEITLEANPDDLNTEYLSLLKHQGFNRLSIGIQSFDNGHLKKVNRRHTGEQAIQAVRDAQKVGFENISIDLIYGLPNQDFENWKRQLDTAFTLGVQHMSIYGLTFEEKTALWKQKEKGIVIPQPDETMNEMYLYTRQLMQKNGFEPYEISNFAQNGYRSKHNSSYWNNESYLGLGPSAHSFDGDSRQWNISSLKFYCDSLINNTQYFEKEELSNNEKLNDYVMVRLRTAEGIDLNFVENEFGLSYKNDLEKYIIPYISSGNAVKEENFIKLTENGILISNHILVELMKI